MKYCPRTTNIMHCDHHTYLISLNSRKQFLSDACARHMIGAIPSAPHQTPWGALVPFSFSSRASVTLWWRFSYKKQNINKVWIHTIVTTCTNSRYLQGTQSKGTLKNTMVLLQYATCQKHGGTMVFFDSEVNK